MVPEGNGLALLKVKAQVPVATAPRTTSALRTTVPAEVEVMRANRR